MSDKISEHFSWWESIVSAKAEELRIDNTLPGSMRATVFQIAHNLEIVRHVLDDQPMTVTSWYRCPELNAAVDGAAQSLHMTARAVDFFSRCEVSLWRKALRLRAAIGAGPFLFGAAILYPESGRIHLDFRDRLPCDVFVARGNGVYQRVSDAELKGLEERDNADT